jgi:hypothetical protein
VSYALAPAEQEPGHAIGRSGCAGTLTARPAGLLFLEEQAVSLSGPLHAVLAGFHEVVVDGHGVLRQ